MDSTQTSYTYGNDVHGSVTQLLDENGGIKASYGYDAYGRQDTKDGDTAGLTTGDTNDLKPFNPYRYAGKRLDSGTAGTGCDAQMLDMGSRRFGLDTAAARTSCNNGTTETSPRPRCRRTVHLLLLAGRKGRHLLWSMAWGAAVRSDVLIETSDRWLLPLSGRTVNQCCIDYAVTLRCEGGIEIRIEAPFVFRSRQTGEKLHLPAEDPVRMAPVLGVARAVVVDAAAFEDGHLEVAFSNGSISVAATEDLEPCEAVGTDGLRVVSVPGGELAVWKPTES
ncbi:DUF6188 family protein [Kribbella antiqua]|uniref:DUF6188 family protein n=1 Tax=Kribbella antiqua TaxID=2512217 RepID=UPI00130544A3|nr:DUF6188 family protein [Kribbella antiqua]